MLIAEGVEHRLREERERLGLSQAEFGALVGVSRGTQKNYELGAATGALDLKYVIALEAKGIDAAYILTGRKSFGEDLSAEEAKIIEQYRKIPAEDKSAIKRFLKAMADDTNNH